MKIARRPRPRREGIEMKRLYIAGAYSADNAITLLNNMRKGMRMGVRVLREGIAPFVPWLDYQFQLMLQGGETLTIDDYYNYSLAWLEVSDAVLVLPGYESSKGTHREMKFARERDIPIFFELDDAVKYLTRVKEMV